MTGALPEAVILAGGLGTRLRSVVPELPKPLAPVAGRPFLAWILDQLAAQGFSQVVLSVGYQTDLIIDRIGPTWQGMNLQYAVEAQPLGTGGAIRAALAQTVSDTVVVLNGDTYLDVDWAGLLAAHHAANALATIAAVRVPDVSRFGGLGLDVSGRISHFREKGECGPGYINGGAYAVQRTLFDPLSLPEKFSFETDCLGRYIDLLRPLAFRVEGFFIDMGVPDDYARAQALFSTRFTANG